MEEGWVELPIVPEVPIYSQESRKDETQSESKTSKTAGRGGPVSVLLGTRCAVVLEEVGVLVMSWRACRSALAVLKWNGGMLGGAGAELRYTVCTGGYPSTHNLAGDSTGRVHKILGKND